MGQKSGPGKEPAEQVVKDIRRATRRQFSAEEKIRIVLSGLRGEDSIAELCRREGEIRADSGLPKLLNYERLGPPRVLGLRLRGRGVSAR